MNLFGCKFCEKNETAGEVECDRKNFDSLLWALVTVFQVFKRNHIPLYLLLLLGLPPKVFPLPLFLLTLTPSILTHSNDAFFSANNLHRFDCTCILVLKPLCLCLGNEYCFWFCFFLSLLMSVFDFVFSCYVVLHCFLSKEAKHSCTISIPYLIPFFTVLAPLLRFIVLLHSVYAVSFCCSLF